MKREFFIVENISVHIGLEQVLTQLGYPQQSCVSEAVKDKIGDEIETATGLIEPRGAYVLLDALPVEGFKLFSGAEGMVLALVTIGAGLEQKAGELVDRGQAAAGLVVDAVGTIAAERAADFLEQTIRGNCVSRGWKVSRRYAPGYCGWDLRAQKELFSWFPDTVGVSLTEACLMVPEKSLSFICLLRRDGYFGMIRVGNCRRCDQANCPYRDQPRANEGQNERQSNHNNR
jgi:hypothetical protein